MIRCVNMIPLTLMYMIGWNLDCYELLFQDSSLYKFDRVLMTLLILTTRCRDGLDFILIEGVTFLSYDLDYGWISLILMMCSSVSVISVFVVLVNLEYIYTHILLHDWFLTISVLGKMLLWERFYWYQWPYYMIRSFRTTIDWLDLLVT